MLQKKRTLKMISITVSILAVGLMMSSPADAADFFDRLAAITAKLPIVKTFSIYIAFLLGIGALIWAGVEMIKISKPETRGEATWLGILIKFVAGAVLVSITFSSDTMQQTLFGTTTAAPSINTQ